jgi:RNA polymerase sigma-70 factor (ECF subfamily)
VGGLSGVTCAGGLMTDETVATPAADFDAFYRESRDRLLAQLYAFTSDRGDAQECLAEAYMRAWQRWPQVSRYDAPEAWVRTVAFRLSVNRWRKATNAAKAWRRHGEPSPMPAPSPDSVDLVRALRELPEQQRRALVLFHVADLSIEEIARETDSPVGTVKARLSRGRAALATLLTEDPLGDHAQSHGASSPARERNTL